MEPAFRRAIRFSFGAAFEDSFDVILRTELRRTHQFACGKSDSPSILVPRLHLGVAQTKLVGQLHAILNAQVLLPFEALLERLQLVIGERCSGFALLFTQARRSGEASHAAFDASTVIVFATWNEAKWKN